MSRDSIDKAIYDKERYEALREQGVSEDRAKRVSTVPLSRKPEKGRPSRQSPPMGDGVGTERVRVEERPIGGAKVKTTVPETGI